MSNPTCSYCGYGPSYLSHSAVGGNFCCLEKGVCKLGCVETYLCVLSYTFLKLMLKHAYLSSSLVLCLCSPVAGLLFETSCDIELLFFKKKRKQACAVCVTSRTPEFKGATLRPFCSVMTLIKFNLGFNFLES